MQDGSWNDTLPHSVLQKEACPPGGVSHDGDRDMLLEASSDGKVYLAEFDGGDGDFLELSAFLSQDEIGLSLDLAREAMSDAGDPCDASDMPPPVSLPKELEPVAVHSPPSPLNSTPQHLSAAENQPFHLPSKGTTVQNSVAMASSNPTEATSVTVTSSQSIQVNRPTQARSCPEPPAYNKSSMPVYKQERPRLVHGGLEVNERAASTTEFCSRAATFIEELSSIFKGSNRFDHQEDDDSSSPDSGYLSPKSHKLAKQQVRSSLSSASFSPAVHQEAALEGMAGIESVIDGNEHQVGEISTDGSMVPPRFTQKLKSQEVAEGSPITLECRVKGNPQPLVRWFCEGRELHHCPDIQIWQDGDLHTLVIAEAFEDDTGRYTCVASNALGADNTSAEVYIEGASSSDSEGEGSVSKSKSGAMPQVQKKTASVSLTIRTSSPKSPDKPSLRSTLLQPLSQRVQSPVSSQYAADGLHSAPPTFTKLLQDAQACEGQLVVLECRVKGSPPLRVQWFRQGHEIQDSPDFRILQKKPRSTAEPEEICTLVIAEVFPEDGGLFCCSASNQYGSIRCSAQLTILPGPEESSRNGISKDNSIFEDNHSFPPPPPPNEISLLEVPPKTPPSAEAFQINELDIWPSVQSAVAVEHQANGAFSSSSTPSPQSAVSMKDVPSPVEEADLPSSPSPSKEGPPIPIKPKPRLRNAEQLKQLHDQVLLEQQEAAKWQQIQQQPEQKAPALPPQQPPQDAPPPSPPLPPPPSFQELECGTMQTSTFNYARPKQFIAAQSPTSPSVGSVNYSTQSSTSSGSSLASPLSPSASHKPFGRVTLPPFQSSPKVGSMASPGSPSFPPPPPPFLSSSTVTSPCGPPQDFPPPPPPPPPPVSTSPTRSDSSSPFTSKPHSPAGFLVSVLPATPPAPPVNALGLPKGNGTVGFPRKTRGTPRIVSDSEIQDTKDAVIQDLERKLRFKEERVSNGQQKLTYEEKMARRLLGADNAATVFSTQQTEEEAVTQESSSTDSEFVPLKEYKVSSFEQRLISEIEFRLERSPVEESDDDVQHGDDPLENCVAPYFDQKLKHFKVFEGMPVTFSCKVIGDPNPKVYWFKDGKQISKRSEHYRISRDPDGTCFLHTAAASLDDDGNYTIMAGNPGGRVSCTGRMMVQAVNQRGRSQRAIPGHIRRARSRSRDGGEENENIQERHFRPHFLQAPGDLIVQEGRLCRMDCKVSGLPTPDLIWQINGHTIRPDSSHKMLVRENGVHSLVIEPVTSRDAGVYTCIASNRAGQNSFNLELIVAAKEMHKAPSFIEKLQNTSVAEGYPVRLECRVSGVPFPQIFWKKENESITHNTDRISMHQDNFGYLCMIIQPALKEDAGWYTVSAKNEAGIVSTTARLDVHHQYQQTHTPKPKKVRPSTSRYAALTERGLDVKAAFFPDSSPLPPGTLVESDDL
ncbi:palladin isoform X1 [Silurus meridionalis]|uniref:palladin isoform X1 n=2 Tax=Silurus meridionalis TaxID=175797 RepID=UPI001EEAE46F|nr:palladin isoform X1 [Silurus meridionalis]